MTFATITALAAAESELHVGILVTFGYGIVALVVFLALGLVTLSYRNVANRNAPKAEAYARTHADELTQAGHGHH